MDRNSYAEFWINVMESKGPFDLFAIATGLEFWHDLILVMFDVTAWYWKSLWGGFIAMGGVVFGLGCVLLKKYHVYNHRIGVG